MRPWMIVRFVGVITPTAPGPGIVEISRGNQINGGWELRRRGWSVSAARIRERGLTVIN